MKFLRGRVKVSAFASHSKISRNFQKLKNFLKKAVRTFFAMRNTAAILILSACVASFSGSSAMQHLLKLSSFGPHPAGSREQEQVKDYIYSFLQSQGWKTEVITFTYQGIQCYNILAYKGNGPGILLGTHYDTRPISDRNPPELRHLPVPGANDGNSGTAVLLELARSLKAPEGSRVWLAFFDAEDRGNIDGWPFSVGAHSASRMNLDLRAVVVADMVGDADLKIYQEANSDRALTESIWKVAHSLGFSEYFVPQVKYSIIDDHLPFALQGIPSALLIDFDYPYWHTTEDTPDKISARSLEIVGTVLKAWVEKEGAKWTGKR